MNEGAQMSEVILAASKREEKGSGVARGLRRNGQVPGVVYGSSIEPVMVSMDGLELQRLLRSDHSLINLKIDKDERRVVIKDVQSHPVSGNLLHIDFLEVVAGQEISVTVPIHFVGTAKGTKMGGIFTTLRSDIAINVLPRYMPESIEIDVNDLEIGDAVRVKDLNYENISFQDDDNELLCQVYEPKKVEETTEDEEADVSAEPEVINAKDDKEE